MALVENIVARLAREKQRMEDECANPPCLHAQGIGLALSWIGDEVEAHEAARNGGSAVQ